MHLCIFLYFSLHSSFHVQRLIVMTPVAVDFAFSQISAHEDGVALFETTKTFLVVHFFFHCIYKLRTVLRLVFLRANVAFRIPRLLLGGNISLLTDELILQCFGEPSGISWFFFKSNGKFSMKRFTSVFLKTTLPGLKEGCGNAKNSAVWFLCPDVKS